MNVEVVAGKKLTTNRFFIWKEIIMGYNTDFKGTLYFTFPLNSLQLEFLQNHILEEDCRDHSDWQTDKDLFCIDLQINYEQTGLEWNGAEKTYSMEKLVNVVIDRMKTVMPEFGLRGRLQAQGEEIGDIWELIIGDNGYAYKKPIVISSVCPHCGKEI